MKTVPTFPCLQGLIIALTQIVVLSCVTIGVDGLWSAHDDIVYELRWKR